MGILVIALSINPRPLSALELTLSGLIMGSRVDTAGDNQNPHVIISNYFSLPKILPVSLSDLKPPSEMKQAALRLTGTATLLKRGFLGQG